MSGWQDRKNRLIELLDASLSEIPDNPVHESYTAKNIASYLTSIRQINEIMRGEKDE